MSSTSRTPKNLVGQLRQELEERPMRMDLDPVREQLNSQVKEGFAGTAIQVVGSNGKGSVVHYLNGLLSRSDGDVVSYTSPHLESINDRICLNGQPISEAFLNSLLAELHETPAADFTPFEKLLLCSVLFAVRRGADFLILEAGMGGRWDATSAIPADLTVLTSVDFEHTEYLGESLESIFREKTTQVPESSTLLAANFSEPTLSELWASTLESGNLTGITLPRAPDPDRTNRRLALMASRLVSDTDSGTLKRQLEQLSRPPGRKEVRSLNDHKVILDVAHTPASIRETLNFVRRLGSATQPRIVYATLKGKEHESIASILQDHVPARNVILCEPPSSRALDPEAFQSRWAETKERPSIETDPVRAVKRALEDSGSGGTVAVLGSFTLIRSIKEHWSQL